jgi:type IV secretory pathway VirB4 component
MSKGKIGEDESSFFGSLVIAKIQLAALRRALIPEEKRKDFYLYVDEFQNFATATFAELVSEARKYRLSTILAHQSISQIENRDIVKIILANVGTVICFKTANPEDEQFILPIFSPEVLKHEIGNLPLYNFYMKVSVGQAQDTFLAQADNFTVRGSEKTAELAMNESRTRYATMVEKTKEQKEEPEKKDAVKTVEKAEVKPVKPPVNKTKDDKQSSEKAGGSLLPRRE